MVVAGFQIRGESGNAKKNKRRRKGNCNNEKLFKTLSFQVDLSFGQTNIFNVQFRGLSVYVY